MSEHNEEKPDLSGILIPILMTLGFAGLGIMIASFFI